MGLRFDHAIIAVHHLGKAVEDYRQLGFTVLYGGEHASGTTHNALICFRDGSYLELLASTGKPPRPGVNAANFSRLLEKGEGLAGYALLSDDLDYDTGRIRSCGISINEPKPGSRLRGDGVEIRWRAAMIENSVSPFFIQDETPRPWRVPDSDADTTHSNGVIGAAELNFVAANLDEAIKRYQDLLGIPTQPREGGSQRASFSLQGMRLTLMLPYDQANRDFLAQRGDAPYSLTLHSTSGQPRMLDSSQSHDATIRFAT
jgi:hypothetical protein